MAILDDNNLGVAAGYGKDPLEELDKELERLRIEMDGLKPAGDDADTDKPGSKKPLSPAGRLTALILSLVCVVTALCACSPRDSGSDPVTVKDKDMGSISLRPPEDASVNTYETTNLQQDENGFYSYYINGVKTSELGVDLSENQGDVDFAAVKAAGVDFVILRIGGRFWGSGGLYTDAKFDEYYQQAKAAGLKVGVYFFSQAINEEEAHEEADYVLAALEGKTLEYPVAFDWESIDDDEARTDVVTNTQLTAIAAAFCDTVNAAGCRSLIYANSSLILLRYHFDTMKNYDFWLADYREMPEQDQMYYHYAIWQYSDEGTVPGVEGTVDMDLCLNAAAL